MEVLEIIRILSIYGLAEVVLLKLLSFLITSVCFLNRSLKPPGVMGKCSILLNWYSSHVPESSFHNNILKYPYWQVWLFPKCFTEFSDEMFVKKHYIRIFNFFCGRPRCFDTTNEILVRDRILRLTPIQASVVYHLLWIHFISVPFRENSIVFIFLSLWRKSLRKEASCTEMLFIRYKRYFWRRLFNLCSTHNIVHYYCWMSQTFKVENRNIFRFFCE